MPAANAEVSPLASPLAAALVAALEACWSGIQARHADVPDVFVTVGAGSSSPGRLKLGHFAAGRWQQGEHATLSELFVGGEGLRRGVDELLATVLHEAAHGIAMVRDLQDTSRQGRYHNTRFRKIGEELGLQLGYDDTFGWTSTSLAAGTAERYLNEIGLLKDALVAHRLTERTATGPPRSNNNGMVAACACPRKIRVATSIFVLGPIVCGVCGQEFAELDS